MLEQWKQILGCVMTEHDKQQKTQQRYVFVFVWPPCKFTFNDRLQLFARQHHGTDDCVGPWN